MISYSNIIKVAYPILLSMLAQNVINVTDTAFLGRLGEVELGASAIAGVFYLMLFMLGIGFSQGLQIFVGRRNGEKNYFLIGKLISNSATVMLLLALALFFAVVVFVEPMLRAVMQSERVCDAAIRFMNIRIFGIFFVYVNVLVRTFFIGIQQTKVLMWNSILMAVTNVVLDYGLIFGHLGFPAMGIEGAALASVISEAVAAASFLLYVYLKVDRRKYGIWFRLGFNVEQLRPVFSVSFFLMVQTAMAMAPYMFFFIAIEQLGERPLAISNILRSLYMLYLIPIDSLAISTSTIVTNTIGEGRKDLVLANVNRVALLALMAIVPLVLLTFIFPTSVLRIYSSDASLISESVLPLYSLALCFIPAVGGRIYFQGLVGTGDTRTSMWIEFATILVYTLYMCWIVLYMRAPVWACWTTEHIYWIILTSLGFYFLRRGRWQQKKI